MSRSVNSSTAHYVFDLVMDQGAYAEFKRHRMMTQTPQLLTHAARIQHPESGGGRRHASAVRERNARGVRLLRALAGLSPHVAQYVVPNGFHRRVLAQFNLREAFAFCELRSAPNAHFSIRLVAKRVAEEIRRVHPLLSQYMRLPPETPAQISQRHFASTGAPEP